MDSRLLNLYERELRHLREGGAAFAAEHPGLASRLGFGATEVDDPYVERLLEGFAFLAARVQLKLDAEYPRFTQSLLEAVCPHYLAPTPSACIVRMESDPDDSGLAEGLEIPRQTSLRSQIAKGEQTACEYRTCQPVVLYPWRVSEASYHTRDAGSLGLPSDVAPAAVLRIRIEAGGGLSLAEIAATRVRMYLPGPDRTPFRLHEQLFARARSVYARAEGHGWHRQGADDALHPVGFEPDDAVFPGAPRSFHAQRLLREYLIFPRRFLFADIKIPQGVMSSDSGSLELLVVFDQADKELEQTVDVSTFALGCTPAVNAFPKRLDRVHVSDRFNEFHVVPERTRPMDYEVHTLREVIAYGERSEEVEVFRPLYASTDQNLTGRSYYTIHRASHVAASTPGRSERSGYVGSEVFISLVDPEEAPYRGDVRQLGIEAICTNRDLPLRLPLGDGRTDFTTDAGAAVRSVRVIGSPTAPRPSYAEGSTAWRLVSQLTLHHASLMDADDKAAAAAVREVLTLHGDQPGTAATRHIEGVRSVRCEPVVRRVPSRGPITFSRGLGIRVELDESKYEGIGIFLMGAVLERFVAAYAGINAFTEFTLVGSARGEIKRWTPRVGRRPMI